MKEVDLIDYINYEIGIIFNDNSVLYGVLGYDDKTHKFYLKDNKENVLFGAEEIKSVNLLKS